MLPKYFNIPFLKKNELLTVSSLTAVSTAIRIVTQLISSKILAIMIGPSGLALLGQLSNASGIAMITSTGALTVGITKYISEYYKDPEKQAQVIQTGMGIIGICSLVTSLLLILASKWLSLLLFGSYQYIYIFIVLGTTISLYAFNTLWVAILNGYNKVRKIVIINIVTSLAGMLFTGILVYYFKVQGAMVSFILGQTLICGVTYFFIRKEKWWQHREHFKIHKPLLKKLKGFTIMAIAAAVITPCTQLIIRSGISKKLSIDAAGIWDGINRISGNYLILFTASVAVYYLPKLSSLNTGPALKKEIGNAYKIIMPVILLSVFGIYFFRVLIIRILFSKGFLPMSDLFAFQLGGDFMKISGWLIAYLMWAKGYVKEFIIAEFLAGLFMVIATPIAIDHFGLRGTSIVYFINNFIYSICIALLMINKLNKHDLHENTNS